MGVPGGVATSLAGVFSLNIGQNGVEIGQAQGGAASSQGTGGISAKGGNGVGRAVGSNSAGGSGGGSLGGGGAGGASNDNSSASFPGIVQYASAPGNSFSRGNQSFGGQGICPQWAGIGEFADRMGTQAGKGGFGAGGGGAGGATNDQPGDGGDPIIIIEY